MVYDEVIHLKKTGSSWWWGGWWITASSVDTLTNKTIDDYTNTVHADWIHLRVKAVNNNLPYWTVLKFVWFNPWEQAIEVDIRDDLNVPSIWVLHDNLLIWEFWMAMSNWLFRNIDTSAFAEWTILYPDDLWSFIDSNPWWYAQQMAYVVRSHHINGEIMLNVWPVYQSIWDMQKSIYDTQNKQQDIYQYARRMALIF